ncbi:zinc finger, RING-type domain-containing protein [Endozoicomonas sp. 4G]|uniref:RING finger protein n=1 Tax=Endozoicomonas sp. 4G TaxID=2872754 RepID=UPI002078D9BD|nr:zinc finger, RING-type domain-containing protein [Endozoicomonas sp. 4G]
MERLLRSLFFFLPFIASVEAHIPDGVSVYLLPVKAATLTESLVTLGVLALRQQTWQPLPYNPEKSTEPEPYNNPFLHVSSDDSFIITDPEPVPGEQITVVHYSHEPKLSFPEYDRSDYRILLKEQQAEMERIHKIAAEGMAMGRVKREQKDKACQEVLSKIVSCANSEPDSTNENNSAPPQEAAQDAPGGQKRTHSAEDEAVATEADSTTQDSEPSAKKQKLQQTGPESELAEDDPQQLLNRYLEGFHVMHTPADNFCWLHAIGLSAGQDVSTLTRTLINMLNHHISGNEQALTAEHSAFLSRWISAQGQENVQLVRRQLIEREWPDFTILLPFLSYLLKKTFVVVNLHASGLTQDQVFTYATSHHVRVDIVSEASAIHTPEETIYLGLLSRDNHYVGIQPDTGDNNYSHNCPVCIEEFTTSRGIRSTTCFHYLCDDCFKKVNKFPAWDCPMCRKRQEFIEPPKQEINEQEMIEQEMIEQESISYSDSRIEASNALKRLQQVWRMEYMKSQKQTHLPAEQRPRVHECNHGGCNYSTNHKGNLKKHQQTHLPANQRARVHQCNHEGCDYRTVYKDNLNIHKQTHLPAAQRYKRTRVRQCNYEDCNYRTDLLGNLKKHQQTHLPADQRPKRPKVRQCNYKGCNYSTDLLGNLKKHLQTHLPADQRPKRPKVRQCNYEGCNYSTDLLGNLKKHLQTHLPADQRPMRAKVHPCDYEDCNYSTDRSANLRRHKQTHLPAFQRPKRPKRPKVHPRDSEDCNYLTSLTYNLKRHKQTHPPLKQKVKIARAYYCDHPGCYYFTNNKDNLQRHTQWSHPPGNQETKSKANDQPEKKGDKE